jgi:hypothetical protein
VRVPLTVILLLAAAQAPAGHHSIAGQFDVSQSMTLQGTIARVDWINPHPYLYLDVRDAKGVTTRWGLSTIPLAMLRKARVTKETLIGKPGEVVTVKLHPAINQRPLGWMTRITYADGRYYALFE